MKKLRLPLPSVRWELVSCALHGHVLLGTDARSLRPADATFARQADGLRMYRCLRCSTWTLRKPPVRPTRDFPPDKANIEPPIRGRLLRDRYILRLIAADRAVHVVLLGAIALVIFLFGAHQTGLRDEYLQILHAFQGVNGSLTFSNELLRLQPILDASHTKIYVIGTLVATFAAIEAVEMVGLWRGRRWAEYLTFVATIAFIPYEVFELVHGVTVIKAVAFAINLAIAGYLLYAKRLFGLNGGTKGEKRERREDMGWAWLERTSPRVK